MGYDDLKELMDIDFPCEALSEDEDHTATGTGTHPSVVPMIDVAVGGWDNDAISQCFSISLATYHQNDAERVFEPVPNRLLIASTGLIQDLSHEGGGTSTKNINFSKTFYCPLERETFSTFLKLYSHMDEYNFYS
eukprot:scaffold409_cov295-Chaetoceros_neogracile.AAC.21